MKLIDKAAVVAEINKLKVHSEEAVQEFGREGYTDNVLFEQSKIRICETLLSLLDTLEVKEVDEQKERMSECPYRQVGCAMYEGKILECKGACSWVVDHLKLKELKAQKGE
jgi:hypothetical protein